jgi:hypothetical protein
MTSYRPAMRTADYVIYGSLICVWTLPWAALSVVMFAPWLASSLFTPFNGFWSGAFALYVADGLGMPLMLLLAGLAIVTAGRGWWWLVAWTTTVATGFAFEYVTLRFALSVFRAPEALGGQRHWEVLAWGGGFALLAAAAGVLLAGSPRAALAPARRRGRRASVDAGVNV